jgi:hypothetical protein
VPANQRWSQSRSGWRSGRRKRKAHLVRVEMSAGGTGIVDRRARRAVFLPSRRIASLGTGISDQLLQYVPFPECAPRLSNLHEHPTAAAGVTSESGRNHTRHASRAGRILSEDSRLTP